MKLTPKSQLGLRLTPPLVEQIFDIHYNTCIKNHPVEEMRNVAILRWSELFIEEFNSESLAIKKLKEINGVSKLLRLKNKNYVMTDSAMSLLKRIKIDAGKFDIRFLSKINNKKITFLLGNNLAIRYIKFGSIILAIKMSTEPVGDGRDYIVYNAFIIDIDNKYIQYEDVEAPLFDANFIFFLQLLIFTELSELEVVELKPKEKTTSTRKEGKYVNESSSNIVIVDSTWNRTSIRCEGFSVCGHFRLQPCGKDFLDRKLIYIDEFEKEGYIRNAKKETVV